MYPTNKFLVDCYNGEMVKEGGWPDDETVSTTIFNYLLVINLSFQVGNHSEELEKLLFKVSFR